MYFYYYYYVCLSILNFYMNWKKTSNLVTIRMELCIVVVVVNQWEMIGIGN